MSYESSSRRPIIVGPYSERELYSFFYVTLWSLISDEYSGNALWLEDLGWNSCHFIWMWQKSQANFGAYFIGFQGIHYDHIQSSPNFGPGCLYWPNVKPNKILWLQNKLSRSRFGLRVGSDGACYCIFVFGHLIILSKSWFNGAEGLKLFLPGCIAKWTADILTRWRAASKAKDRMLASPLRQPV